MSERIIKKYPNRRLYDTQTSSYITLVDVKQYILNGEQPKVLDVRDESDITHEILLQLILEQENLPNGFFSNEMLTQMIRHHGQAMQGMMQQYLAQAFQFFDQAQERFQSDWQKAAQGIEGVKENWMTNWVKANQSLWQKAQSQWWGTPFSSTPPEADKKEK